MNDCNESIRAHIHDRLQLSKIPISEILTPNVFFTSKFCGYNSIYIYIYKKKYYLKIVTYRKDEEEIDVFENEEDLIFRLVKNRMWIKALRERSGNIKEATLNYIKDVDKDFYIRALKEL